MIALLLAALTTTACDSDSPTAPSRRQTLEGTVSDGSQGIAFADVEILSGPGQGERTTADIEGRYHLSLLGVGNLFVRASASGYEPHTQFLHIDSSTTLDFELSRRSDSAGRDDLVTVAGVARDADSDTPIPGADVTVTNGPAVGRSTITDDDGGFRLDRLSPGPLSLRIAAPGYRPVTRDVVAGDVGRLSVSLERDAAQGDQTLLSGVVVEVLVPGMERVPIEGARVMITTGTNTERTTRTDRRGRYLLEPLTPGPATVEVSAPTFETMTSQVTLRLRTTTHDIELERVEAVVSTPGRVVDVLTGTAIAGVTISGTDLTAETTDAAGTFEVGARAGSTAPRLVELTSPEIVSRRAYIRVPDVETEISVIPAQFNLTAFDEMLRRDILRRWRTAPPLIIERQTLEFSDVDMSEATALDDPMSDAELQSLLTDLRWALPLLTGETFSRFAAITERETAPGMVSTLLTSGAITVVRVEGLHEATGSWGWSRWLFRPDGTVTGGLMMLDLAFDRSDSPFRRSLRAHELGHTLGCTHVSTEGSVMNIDARVEPTAFDRDATRIAFSRLPGNLAPDVEPAPQRQSTGSGRPTWSRAIR